MAPTGSSTLMRSKKSTAPTTNTPAMAPITTELPTLTKAHGAVMATRPARAPLMIIVRSGLPIMSHAARVAVNAAVAAAVLVVTAMRAISAKEAAIVLPGLNPNHPNHRMRPPAVAVLRL